MEQNLYAPYNMQAAVRSMQTAVVPLQCTRGVACRRVCGKHQSNDERTRGSYMTRRFIFSEMHTWTTCTADPRVSWPVVGNYGIRATSSPGQFNPNPNGACDGKYNCKTITGRDGVRIKFRPSKTNPKLQAVRCRLHPDQTGFDEAGYSSRSILTCGSC
jgi:hypothetical protein